MKRQKRQLNGKIAKQKVSSESHSEDGIKKSQAKATESTGEPLCLVCESVGPEISCSGACKHHFHLKCVDNSKQENFICDECSSGNHPCFLCKNSDGSLKKCSMDACGKFYHSDCLKKLRTSNKDGFVCPLHSCLTCGNNQKSTAANKSQLVRCIRCPVAYHSKKECIAAGCCVLSSSVILCPGHFVPVNGNMFQSVANIPWCSVCAEGGQLLHCRSCPASYHENCLSDEFTLVDNVCKDCMLRKYPLYGNIVWVKIGSFRWWPAKILDPEDVLENLRKQNPCAGEFPVQYFGTKEYFWTHKGRVHPYFCVQEELSAENFKGTSALEAKYKLSIEEANDAVEKWVESSVVSSGKSKPQYKHIRFNRPVGNVQAHVVDISTLSRCGCDPKSENPCGYNSECLNRTVLIECHPSVCPAGESCLNQAFQKRQYLKVVPFRTEQRGWALKTLEDIPKGKFVIEYVGDLIDEEECNRRLTEKNKNNDPDFYFLTIDKDRIIDAGPSGNLSRFLNHSCSPNCETQKWLVNGETRIGIFAKEDISAGTELTFDYKMDSMDHYKLKCLCGAKNCRGVIGVKTQHAVSKPRLKKKAKQNHQAKSSAKKSCFLCSEPNNLVPCDFKGCSKWYHFECLGRNDKPSGRWQCPWHHCSTCGRLSKYMCAKCTISFCDKHKTAENIVLVSGEMFCPKHAST